MTRTVRTDRAIRRPDLIPFVGLLGLVVFLACLTPGLAWAQENKIPADQVQPKRLLTKEESLDKAAKDLAAKEPGKEKDTVGAVDEPEREGPNLLWLLCKGGNLMWPIAVMSVLVVAFGIERILGLRRRKVLPVELVQGLGDLAAKPGGFDPRRAYRLCQEFPSAAASVIRAMLLKIGRPHTELEQAIAEASQREANRLYANVRWLNLAAGVAPLMGLLGTVWGMIEAFFETANMAVGANKAELLAGGIYKALVTTFAGLAVAIPAAVLAHVLEGRIERLFRELDEILLGLMPQLERFEGRMRSPADGSPTAPPEPPPARPEPPPARARSQP
ncbi:MAG: MotA/TolQ/ExbB proton channel family protein [Pirellulales bacterium]|nr:MotA/TolQ/ExbB proton channel family protein [Pirellulales bacterium]